MCYVWTSSMQRCSVVRTDTDLVHSLYIVSSLCSGEDRLSLHWYWPGLVYTYTGMGQHLAYFSTPRSRGRGMNELLWSTQVNSLFDEFLHFVKKNIHDSEHQVGRYCSSWMIIQVCEKRVFIRNWPKYVYCLLRIIQMNYIITVLNACGSSVRSIFHWLVVISWARSRSVVSKVVKGSIFLRPRTRNLWIQI